MVDRVAVPIAANRLQIWRLGPGHLIGEISTSSSRFDRAVFDVAGKRLGERREEIYLPTVPMGERGSCRAWLWFGRSLSLPV